MLSGSAMDLPGGFGAGISTVQVKIMYEPNNNPVDAANRYWNGSTWQSGVAYAHRDHVIERDHVLVACRLIASITGLTSAGAQYVAACRT